MALSSADAATTITVNSTAQEATAANPNGVANGNCTLGEAILAANANATVDGCTVSGGGAPFTIVLSQTGYLFATAHNYWYGPNSLPPVASTIIIEGNGATLLFSINPVRLRFFFIGAPVGSEFFTPGSGNLTLHNLTLIGGTQKGGISETGGGGAGMGGAIFNQGTLTLDSVTLLNNTATGGHSQEFGTGLAGGGGMGADAGATAGGGFGGSVPGGSSGGAGSQGAGGGGGGFKASDNGSAASPPNGGNGGGTPDGLGGSGGLNGGAGGHGSGGGGGELTPGSGGNGGGFGSGGSSPGGGGGVGGGGASNTAGGGGGGGGFGGGGGATVNTAGGNGGFGGGGGGTGVGTFGSGGFGGGSGGASEINTGGDGAGFGGAIFNHGGTLTVVNSTFNQNAAYGGCCGFEQGKGYGGAIFNLNGSVVVRFSTLDSNIASDGGGAMYNLGYSLNAGVSASVTIDRSILSNSNDGSNGDGTGNAVDDLVNNKPATVASGGANNATAALTFLNSNIVMSWSNTGGTVTGAPTSNADPMLAPPFLNPPGLTPTMAITMASPAFNKAVCGTTTIDQRTVTRPQGVSCDIGAYELIVPPFVVTNPQPQTVCVGGTATFTASANGASSVKWQVSTNGGPFNDIPGANTATLSFPATLALNGNQYQAVFTNGVGSVTTTPATLTVATTPIASSIGGNTLVTVGQTVTFTASATGTPTPTVQWQISADQVTWTNIPGATSTTLTFTADATTIGKFFRAVFTNPCSSAVTDPVVLTTPSTESAYVVRYLSNLNIADSYVNISNTGTVSGNDPAGALCANVYVFDPNEEPVSCCACPVTPNGLVSLSAVNSLIVNRLTGTIPSSIVVKILFTAKPVGASCDAGALPSPTPLTLARGGVAWAITPHANTFGNQTRYELAETEFARSELSQSEYQKLVSICRFIETYASGFGLCKGCQAGGRGAVAQ